MDDEDDWPAPSEFGVKGLSISAAAIVSTAVVIHLAWPKPKPVVYIETQFTIPRVGLCTIPKLNYNYGYWRCSQ